MKMTRSPRIHMQDEDGDSDDDASAASTRESTSDEPWLSSDWLFQSPMVDAALRIIPEAYRDKVRSIDARHANRLLFSAFAVAALWISSLSVSTSLAELVVSTPTGQDVKSTCDFTHRAIKEQKRNYAHCIKTQLGRCEVDYAEALAREILKTSEATEENKQTLVLARDVSSDCSGALSDARSALREYSSLDASHSIVYLGDDNDCDDVASDIGDISETRTEALEEATSFSASSTTTVSRLAAYSKARSAYDAQYLANKTESVREAVAAMVDTIVVPFVELSNASFSRLYPNVDWMVSCVSTREGDDYAKCPLTVSARSLYNQALSLAEGQVAIVETSLEDTMSEAESFAVRVVNAYERLSNLVDSLTSWFDSRATPDFFDQVSLLDFFAAPPSFCSNVYQTGSCDFPSLDFDALPEARYLYPDELDLAYANFLHNMSLASVETFSRAVEMKETLIAAVGGLATISDYSPPKYSAFGGDVDNVDEESERHQAEADAFVEQQANTLNSASLQSEFDNDDGSIYNFNLTEASDATSVDLLDVFSWITPLEESRVDWGEIFVVGMSRLTTLLLIFDYVWRVVQSYRVIQRFWGRSGVKLPRPDLRFDSSDDRGQYCECLIKYVWLISTVSSSLIILIVLVIAACVVVTAAYQPIFNEYQRGCVRDDTNGTFLSSNLNSVAYNYASIEGSSQYTRRIGDYDAARTEACSVYSTSTQFERKRLKLASYIESFETSASGIEKLEDCVDVESMSAEFDRVCCGLENYEPCSIGDSVFHNGTFCPRDGNGEPHLKIRDYLGGCSSTDDAWYSLNDDEDFDCDNLPLCSTTCDGPNREVVEVVTKQCACTAEYYAHSHFLRISLALLIYVLTNLSRFIFVSAACKLLWRQLTPELVDCTITSTLQGDLLIPPRMSCGAAGVNPMAAAASSPPDDDESTEPAKASVIVTDNNISFQEKSFSTSHSGNASMSSQKPPHLEVPLGYQHLLQRKIKSEIASWERSAWLELVLALLVNVPWIVLMRLANDDDIVYTP